MYEKHWRRINFPRNDARRELMRRHVDFGGQYIGGECRGNSTSEDYPKHLLQYDKETFTMNSGDQTLCRFYEKKE